MTNNVKDINAETLASALIDLAKQGLESELRQKISDWENLVHSSFTNVQEKIQAMDDLLAQRPTFIQTKPINGEELQAPKLTHNLFKTIAKILVSSKRKEKNIMLVGPAGGGKSYMAQVLAEAVGLQFCPMSVGIQTTKSDLMGFVNAMGNYVTSPVRKAFEEGGVLLLDEFDAANAGVVTILNALLANNIVSFPDKTVTKHPNFICICACNTYGRGADVEYVGRNRLDAATLDRFIVVDMGYDYALERALVKQDKWLDIVHKMRENAASAGIKHIISPRASMDGADLLEQGFSIHDVLEMCVFKGAEENVRNHLLKDIVLPPKPIFDKNGKIVGYESTNKETIKVDGEITIQ